MSEESTNKLKHFQSLLEANPESKAFAPLAEGYRKQGDYEKALQIAMEGVQRHPKFNSGKVALSQILIDLKKYTEAEQVLKEVTSQDRENLLAQKLLGKANLLQENFGEALTCYKNALLINPLDQMSNTMVKKLETLSVQSFDVKIFEELDPSLQSKESKVLRKQSLSLESSLSYLDALISKASYAIALGYIEKALLKFPNQAEILKRKAYIEGLKQSHSPITREDALTKPEDSKRKILTLQKALEQIELRASQKET